MPSPNLTTFFEQRLPIERHAGENTRDSDAYAFQLLLGFASKRICIRSTPTEMQSISENDFECLASTAVNAPGTM